MAIENIDRSITQIYKDVGDKTMVLPRFQRGFVWPRDKQANLISSFLVSLPFGSLLCLNGNRGDFITRQLCYTTIIEDASDSVDYILDGQQRLSTLRSVIYDIFHEEGIDDWRTTWDKLYGTLRTRWFVRLKPDEEEEDVFGFNALTIPNLSAFTDTDIKDFVEFRAINKTRDLDKPYHPEFDRALSHAPSGAERVQLRNQRREYFAKENLVPLYEVYKGESGIHKDVLEKIANTRLEILKDTLNENISPTSIYEHFRVYGELNSIEEAEDLYYEHFDESDPSTLISVLNDKWASIKANWVQKLVFELSQLKERRIPIVRLDQSETNRAIAIFEAINKGGVGLSVFDLTVAKAASSQGSDLVTSISTELSSALDISSVSSSFDIQEWKPEYLGIIDGDEPIKQFKDWFVNVLSLYVHCSLNKLDLNGPTAIKREAILSLTSDEINDNAEIATKGISRALAFLNLRCGLTKAQDIPFKLALVVIAYYLCNDDNWRDPIKLNKLEYWYWIAMLTGQYTYRQNEQCIEDIKKLDTFLEGEGNPFISRRKDILNFADCNEEIILRKDEDNSTESSSIKSLVLQYILSKRPYDFTSAGDARLQAWDIAIGKYTVEAHHIVPLTGATSIERSTKEIRSKPNHILNSLMNMTYISREANQAIKDRDAADYLSQLTCYNSVSHMIDQSSISAGFNEEQMIEFVRSRFTLLKSNISSHLDTLV